MYYGTLLVPTPEQHTPTPTPRTLPTRAPTNPAPYPTPYPREKSVVGSEREVYDIFEKIKLWI